MSDDVLTAPHVLEYAYTRSTGPVIGGFMTALRERRIVGVRATDGRVLVPPQEYDPATAAAIDELVEVGSEGEVTTWSWQPTAKEGQPLDHPFAWALVRLDGADTALLHAVDVDSPEKMRTGMRVRVRWSEEPRGDIHDIVCFEPVDDEEGTA